jgi:hypothetical protein
MQISTFNKRHGAGSGVGILGIDADAIARLPHPFRAELIAALTEAEDALASGDEALQRAATVKLTKLLGSIDARRSEAITEKAFMDFMRPVRGDHAVMKKFAAHACTKA